MKIFKDRREAGKLLAKKLGKYQDQNAVILAVPRGGVVVAVEVSKILKAPLDLVFAKKITSPLDREFAVGAVSEDGFIVVKPGEEINVSQDWFLDNLRKAKEKIVEQRELYLKNFSRPNIEGKIVIIIDDGLATGLTMEAAIKEVKSKNPTKIIVAIPVAPVDTVDRLKNIADEIAVLEIPDIFLGSVGAYYEEFDEVSDKMVKNILKVS